MRPLFLHLDDALLGQPALLADGRAAGAAEIDARDLGPDLRLWSRPAALDRLMARLDAAPLGAGPHVAFYGSGDFHHVSALLIDRAVAAAGGGVTVVHIDNHPDWVRFGNGLHCGSWASRVARREGIDAVLTIGPTSGDIRQAWRKGADLALVRDGRIELYPHGGGHASHCVAGVRRPTITGMGADLFGSFLVRRIGAGPVYLTIDKDALAPADAITNWDQGCLTLAFVMDVIGQLAAGTFLIGADVCGDWSTPVYGGRLVTRLVKRGEAWLDQPRRRPAAAGFAANENTNRALLHRLVACA